MTNSLPPYHDMLIHVLGIQAKDDSKAQPQNTGRFHGYQCWDELSTPFLLPQIIKPITQRAHRKSGGNAGVPNVETTLAIDDPNAVETKKSPPILVHPAVFQRQPTQVRSEYAYEDTPKPGTPTNPYLRRLQQRRRFLTPISENQDPFQRLVTHTQLLPVPAQKLGFQFQTWRIPVTFFG